MAILDKRYFKKRKKKQTKTGIAAKKMVVWFTVMYRELGRADEKSSDMTLQFCKDTEGQTIREQE